MKASETVFDQVYPHGSQNIKRINPVLSNRVKYLPPNVLPFCDEQANLVLLHKDTELLPRPEHVTCAPRCPNCGIDISELVDTEAW